MLAAVAGGTLQGVEAAYLGRKAGWEVVVLDRHADACAAGMCDRFETVDLEDEGAVKRLLAGVDVLIPALEDDAVLASLERSARSAGVPFAFDPKAYAISSSKKSSDDLFAASGIPAPKPWPDGDLPVIVKPSCASGSAGVRLFDDAEALGAFLERAEGEWVVQSFVDGPTYSLEVTGRPGNYRTFQVTDLSMDAGFDCRAVSAPSVLPAGLVSEFEALSLKLAQLVKLKGLMDVEVVAGRGALKVLEIDARFPSQTPTAVYHSTGANLLEALVDVFLPGPSPVNGSGTAARGVVYEHIRVTGNTLEFSGEHVMSKAGRLHVEKGFFGADEAITNRRSGRQEWVATLIVTAKNRQAALEKRRAVLTDMRRSLGLEGEIAPI